jgi:hypothetical protein
MVVKSWFDGQGPVSMVLTFPAEVHRTKKKKEFFFFSFQCGGEYHAPTDCETIKRWLTKCADDSETANYISAHTKDVSTHAASGCLMLSFVRTE